MVICSFVGHKLARSDLMKEVITEVEKIVLASDESVFYSGSMGDFDKICEQAVRETKKKYPDRKICLCKVLPSYGYIKDKQEQDFLKRLYDEVFVCSASDGAHYKAMIGKRNRWMMEQSDYIIAYVKYDSGGACRTLRYAQRLGKKIFRVGNEE